MKKQDAEAYRVFIRTSAIGLEVGLSIVVGFFLGHTVDRYAGTKPWGSIIGFVFGVLAAGKTLYTFSKKYLKDNQDDEK